MADLTITAADVSASQVDGAIIRDFRVSPTGATVNIGDLVAETQAVSSVTGVPDVIQAKGNTTDWATSRAIGVVAVGVGWYGDTTVVAGNHLSAVVFGPVYLPGASLIPGAIYYTSDNAGKISDTPSTTHPWIIGQALDVDVLFVNPRGTGSTNY